MKVVDFPFAYCFKTPSDNFCVASLRFCFFFFNFQSTADEYKASVLLKRTSFSRVRVVKVASQDDRGDV